ncbi:MAG: ACP S-malonyltransferase [bacterium]
MSASSPLPVGPEPARRTPIVLFPGQSAYHPDMLRVAVERAPALASPLVEEAAEAIGFDLAAAVATTERPDNRLVQLGVFVANHLHLAALRAAGVPPGLGAGMSLGEYNHLVDIGALDFSAALALVDARGRLYDAGPAGVMIALFPVEAAVVEEAIAALGVPVTISNHNSPQQQVIAGPADAVAQVARLLDERDFVDARLIEARLPMHGPHFAPVAPRLEAVLRAVSWRRPTRPYVANVLGGPVDDPTPDVICRLLTAHVCQPVRWRQSIEWLAAQAPEPVFIEVGPGRALANLMRRPWRTEPCFSLAEPAALDATLAALCAR